MCQSEVPNRMISGQRPLEISSSELPQPMGALMPAYHQNQNIDSTVLLLFGALAVVAFILLAAVGMQAVESNARQAGSENSPSGTISRYAESPAEPDLGD